MAFNFSDIRNERFARWAAALFVAFSLMCLPEIAYADDSSVDQGHSPDSKSLVSVSETGYGSLDGVETAGFETTDERSPEAFSITEDNASEVIDVLDGDGDGDVASNVIGSEGEGDSDNGDDSASDELEGNLEENAEEDDSEDADGLEGDGDNPEDADDPDDGGGDSEDAENLDDFGKPADDGDDFTEDGSLPGDDAPDGAEDSADGDKAPTSDPVDDEIDEDDALNDVLDDDGCDNEATEDADDLSIDETDELIVGYAHGDSSSDAEKAADIHGEKPSPSSPDKKAAVRETISTADADAVAADDVENVNESESKSWIVSENENAGGKRSRAKTGIHEDVNDAVDPKIFHGKKQAKAVPSVDELSQEGGQPVLQQASPVLGDVSAPEREPMEVTTTSVFAPSDTAPSDEDERPVIRPAVRVNHARNGLPHFPVALFEEASLRAGNGLHHHENHAGAVILNESKAMGHCEVVLLDGANRLPFKRGGQVRCRSPSCM